MKTLERFWHWVDNEKPAPLTAAQHANLDWRGHTLSCDAIGALEAAAALIVDHVRPFARPGSKWHSVYACFGTDAKREHLRDLSLAICPLLARMRDELAVELGTAEEQERAKAEAVISPELRAKLQEMCERPSPLLAKRLNRPATETPTLDALWNERPCGGCSGTGLVIHHSPFIPRQFPRKCKACAGSGRVKQ